MRIFLHCSYDRLGNLANLYLEMHLIRPILHKKLANFLIQFARFDLVLSQLQLFINGRIRLGVREWLLVDWEDKIINLVQFLTLTINYENVKSVLITWCCCHSRFSDIPPDSVRLLWNPLSGMIISFVLSSLNLIKTTTQLPSIFLLFSALRRKYRTKDPHYLSLLMAVADIIRKNVNTSYFRPTLREITIKS